MKQSRLMSLVEAVANAVVGYMLAIATQIAVFPLFGIGTGLRKHLTIGLAFVGVSLARGYALRRQFERLRAGLLDRRLGRWSTPASIGSGGQVECGIGKTSGSG